MPPEDNLIKAIGLLQQKGIPFAVYQHPENNEICVVAQVEPVHMVHNIKEICFSSGFLIFPFESAKTGVGYFIKNNLFACSKTEIDELINRIKKIPNRVKEETKTESYEMSKPEYLDIARRFIQKMKDGVLQKVVLSRIKTITPDKGFNSASFFMRLTKKYPNTFVYLFSIPDEGTWVGATPETLLSQKNNGDIVVMSLAGTMVYPDNGEVKWGQKEIIEQGYVSAFIRERLLKLGINNFTESAPITVKAGHLAHIQTIFSIPYKSVNNNIEKLIKSLHPTPAVCGLPQNTAYSLIETHEPHGRKFYTGFLGPWLLNGRSDLFVNLRCAEINADTLNLYVGGGLTAESNPEKEWQETELKAQTLKRGFRSKRSPR